MMKIGVLTEVMKSVKNYLNKTENGGHEFESVKNTINTSNSTQLANILRFSKGRDHQLVNMNSKNKDYTFKKNLEKNPK